MQKILLTRDFFRNSVFERDNYKCVVCGKDAVDAHHIIERRLFEDSGYYLDNGVSLCMEHHLMAEKTTISCEDLRKLAGIKNVILPDHFYIDSEYDKWGNEILRNGTRIKGELFNDESVQKILKEGKVLHLFTDTVKYPRTFHLPWSPGMNRDDRMMESTEIFEDEDVCIMEKTDGENTTWTSSLMHARSLDTSPHESRKIVKGLWSTTGFNIPEGWRVCGENMYAKHAIHYTREKGNALDSYFLAFSIWDDTNTCLSWEETTEWFQLLGLVTPKIFYVGKWNIKIIEDLNLYMEKNTDTVEGYVVRLCRKYHYSEFRRVCGKYVRRGHVNNNHGHWAQSKITPNELKEGIQLFK